MDEKEIMKQLESLQEIKAPKRLHAQLFQQTAFLPEKHNDFYFPLFAFRIGLAFAVVLLCVLATSGIVVAAAHSQKNTPLYPVKVLIQKVAPNFIEQKGVKGESAPTPRPTNVPTITQSIQEKKYDEGEPAHRQNTLSPTHRENQGVHKEVKEENHNSDNSIKHVKDSMDNSVNNIQNTVDDLLH